MKYNQGSSLIKIILIIVMLVIFISLLGWNIESDVVQNEEVQTNFQYVLNWLGGIWDHYLSTPILYLWNDIFIDLLWQPFVQDFLSGTWFDQIPSPGDIQV